MKKRSSTTPAHGSQPKKPPASDSSLHQALAAVRNMEAELVLAPQMPSPAMITHAATKLGITATMAAQIYIAMIEIFMAEN